MTITSLPFRKYLEFLPPGSAYKSLKDLTRLYSGDEYDQFVELSLNPKDLPGCRLGKKQKSSEKTKFNVDLIPYIPLSETKIQIKRKLLDGKSLHEMDIHDLIRQANIHADDTFIKYCLKELSVENLCKDNPDIKNDYEDLPMEKIYQPDLKTEIKKFEEKAHPRKIIILTNSEYPQLPKDIIILRNDHYVELQICEHGTKKIEHGTLILDLAITFDKDIIIETKSVKVLKIKND